MTVVRVHDGRALTKASQIIHGRGVVWCMHWRALCVCTEASNAKIENNKINYDSRVSYRIARNDPAQWGAVAVVAAQ